MPSHSVPTKTVADTLQRVLTMIQRSNSWTKAYYIDRDRDSQGKTRTSYCLAGAIRAAVAGVPESADRDSMDDNRIVKATRKLLLRTLQKNPSRYGVADFNGFMKNAHEVVEALNDLDGFRHSHALALVRDALLSLKA